MLILDISRMKIYLLTKAFIIKRINYLLELEYNRNEKARALLDLKVEPETITIHENTTIAFLKSSNPSVELT